MAPRLVLVVEHEIDRKFNHIDEADKEIGLIIWTARNSHSHSLAPNGQ